MKNLSLRLNKLILLLFVSIFALAANPALAAVCGDSEPDPTEQCDDGNTTPGDGCSAICEVENNFFCTAAIASQPPDQAIPSSCYDLQGAGSFTVYKNYNDNNITPVAITAECTGGGIFVANPLQAGPGLPATFTYVGYIGNPTCNAMESVIPEGYTPDETDCQKNDSIEGSCTITNSFNAVSISHAVPSLPLWMLALLIIAIVTAEFRRRRTTIR